MIVYKQAHTCICEYRERERQRQTDRQTDRQRETETERQTDRDRQTETDRQRQTETDRQRQTETDRQRAFTEMESTDATNADDDAVAARFVTTARFVTLSL